MKAHLGGIMLVTALALAGCGSGGTTAASTPAPTTSSTAMTPEVTTSSSTTAEGISTAAIASEIAQQRGQLDSLVTDLQDCPSIDDIQQFTCGLVADRAQPVGGIIRKALEPLAEQSPAPEVAQLLDETIAAAARMERLKVSQCKGDGTKPLECSNEITLAKFTTDAAVSKFDGWKPYGA